MFISFLLGIVASATHVMTGPDHLAAVTPLAIENKKKSWIIGISWGIGHTTGLLLIGILFYLFREVFPIKLISAYSEIIVGIILIVIGLWAFYKLLNKNLHKHKEIKNIKAAVLVGILHGFAGIYHILIVLPALALPSEADAGFYLFGFAAGTVTVMALFAWSLGSVSQKASLLNKKKFLVGFRVFGGSAAIIVGIIWIALSF
ncbi:MAG: sulfite exporter TauE/SafE family protein [Bacteroidales bacterium]|nr:sulfite exporter TauE/SafE family protein [Bacteroidales bacterium]